MGATSPQTVDELVEMAYTTKPADWIPEPRLALDDGLGYWMNNVMYSWDWGHAGQLDVDRDDLPEPFARLVAASEELLADLHRDVDAMIRTRLVAMGTTFEAEFPEVSRR